MIALRAAAGTVAVALAALLAAPAAAQQPVEASATTPGPIRFANDIVPILTKSGCNAGSCHGAAAGKNGFPLSLFGYDPTLDHRMLTRDLRGRRLDPAAPDDSLMLLKATARVPHQGGKRFDPDSASYAKLRAWIAAGAPGDPADAPRLVGIDLEPPQAVLLGPDQPLSLRVRARFDDGERRDVSDLTIWSSSNDATLRVDAVGHASSSAPGEAYVLARYGTFAAVAQVQVHADAAPFAFPEVAEANFVDTLVHQKLRAAHVVPAAVCSDAVFVRRVYFDLLMMPPPPEVARAFAADPSPDKRERLVDDLLQRDEFADSLAMDWAEVLQVDAETMGAKGAALLSRHLRAAFRERRPLDVVVRELLTAQGATFTTPAANFFAGPAQPNLLAEQTAQVFLGIRMQCAQCHNHPFESWTMDDYYGFAAFFGQVARKRGEDPTEWIVYDRRSGDVRNKRDNTIAAPMLLGGAQPKLPEDQDRRGVLAAWLTAPDNPWFARHVANRAFARVFGRGIVDPPDDVRVSNPASHPELLDRLAALLVASAFDVRPVFRALCTSRTYQLARHPDAPPAALFAGNLVRRLGAEPLLAAIDAVTGVPTRFPGLPDGSTATAIASGRSDVRFLELFGRPARASACTCERSAEPTLGQTLHLANGDTIPQKLAARSGRLATALRAKAAPEAMLDELFLAAYSRLPDDREREAMLGSVRAAEGDAARTAAWQDLYWAVLNSKEFLFQH